MEGLPSHVSYDTFTPTLPVSRPFRPRPRTLTLYPRALSTSLHFTPSSLVRNPEEWDLALAFGLALAIALAITQAAVLVFILIFYTLSALERRGGYL